MVVDKLIEELTRLKEKGYGKNEVVMFENLIGDKLYHTTVEELKV